MDLTSIREKSPRYGIGLTAGASCVGIDAALVRVKGSGPGLSLKLIHARHYPYPKGLRSRLLASRHDAKELGLLNVELGERLADAALEMRKAAGEELEDVDYIGLQGHIASHTPRRGGSQVHGLLQIGDEAVVAERTGLPVVSDFCSRDVAAGGQGKPFSSYADWLIFARDDRTVASLHLGAYARLNVITPALEEVVSFETGPCNIAIDGAVQLLTSGNRDMDEDGAAAAKGVVIDEFLEYLLDHPYFSRVPPKSTSREDFGPQVYLRDALAGRRDHSLEDLIATVSAAVAYSVIRAHTRFVKPSHDLARIIVSGGGMLNRTLLKNIRKGISETVVRKSDKYNLPHDALDALRVAVLASETLSGKPGNACHASGAERPVLLGRLTMP